MRKEAEDWLVQAEADMKTAGDCLTSGNYYAAAFFAQQAAEKVLKSYYILKKQEIAPRTHSLLELGLELELPDELLTIARELTPEFVISRYPNVVGTPPVKLYDERSAKEILDKARRIFEWVKDKMKS